MSNAVYKVGQVAFDIHGETAADVLAEMGVIAANAPAIFQAYNETQQAANAVGVAAAMAATNTQQVPVQAAQAPPPAQQAQQAPVYNQPAPVQQQVQYTQPVQQPQYAQQPQVQYAGPPPQGTPMCAHGPKKDLLGRTTASGAPYKFRYYCAAGSNDPTKCNPAGSN